MIIADLLQPVDDEAHLAWWTIAIRELKSRYAHLDTAPQDVKDAVLALHQEALLAWHRLHPRGGFVKEVNL